MRYLGVEIADQVVEDEGLAKSSDAGDGQHNDMAVSDSRVEQDSLYRR